jgi:hypothetical protein
MPTALEVELKTYAHNLVATYVKEEYESQIRSKWQPYINHMVDAQAAALKQHQKVLDAVRLQIQEEKDFAFGLAMLALTFVSGPALSWIAGKIQYKVFPKLTEVAKVRDRALWLAKWNTENWSRLSVLELDHDKVWAKVFGDLGKEVVGLGVKTVHKVVTPPSQAAKDAIQLAAKSDQTSFKTNLENAMLAEADLTIKAILSVATDINENSIYGAQCLAKLKQNNPRLNAPGARVKDDELERLAKQMIREDINKQRQKWADEWFYYGNDPGSREGLAEAIELEMWSLWILNEQLKLVKHYRGSPDNPLVSTEVLVVEGKTFGGKPGIPGGGTSFGERGIPEGVLVRLAEFGTIEARTQLQKLRAIAAQGVKEAKEAEEARKEQEARAAEEASEDLDDSRSASPELARFNRAMERAAKKQNPSRKGGNRPDPDNPLIAVGTSVDTQAEIDAIEAWAKTHALKLLGGKLPRIKRSLPSVEKIVKTTSP